jgi:hypothetical protein
VEVEGAEEDGVRDAHPASVHRGDPGDHHPGRRVAGDPGEVLAVRLERRDPALQRLAADVDAVGRSLVAGDQEPPGRPRLEPLIQELGEHPAVPRVAHGVHGREPRDAVVGLVQPGHELDLPAADHDGVRTVAPDPAGDVTPHLHRVGEDAVGVLEEVHLRHPDGVRARDLLTHPQLRRLRGRQRVHARLPAREQEVGDVDAARGPRGHRRRRAVLHVVGVRDHAQHTIERVVRERGERIGLHRPNLGALSALRPDPNGWLIRRSGG